MDRPATLTATTTRTEQNVCFLLLWCVFVAVFYPSSQCPLGPNTMTPTDPKLFVGDTLQLCCNLTSLGLDIQQGRVQFTRLTDVVCDVDVTSSDDNVCMELKMEHAHKKFYYCNFNSTDGEDCTVLGYQYVMIFDPPAPVLDLRCLLEKGNFACQFTNPSKPLKHPERISVNMQHGLKRTETNGRRSCNLTCEGDWCTCVLEWGRDLMDLDVEYDIIITVDYVYEGRILRSSNYTFSKVPQEWDKIMRPQSLRVTETGPFCLNLTWVTYFVYEEQQLLLSLTSQWIQEPLVYEFPNNVTAKRICQLVPYTTYNITLQVRRRTSKVWSDATSVSVRTRAAVPGMAPKLAPGCSVTDDDSITIYWEPIPKKLTHGANIHYVVKVYQTDISHRVMYTVNTTKCQLPITLRNLHLKQDSRILIKVYAANEEGLSEKASGIYLSRNADGVHDVKAIVEEDYNGTTYLDIAWSGHSQEPYAVFWCQRAGHSSNLCDESQQIHWATVSANSLRLEDVPHDPGLFMYGVSKQRLDRQLWVKVASGFRFHTCVLTRKEDGSLRKYSGCEDTVPTVTVLEGFGRGWAVAIAVCAVAGIVFFICCVRYMRQCWQRKKELCKSTVIKIPNPPSLNSIGLAEYGGLPNPHPSGRSGYENVTLAHENSTASDMTRSGSRSEENSSPGSDVPLLASHNHKKPEQNGAGLCLLLEESTCGSDLKSNAEFSPIAAGFPRRSGVSTELPGNPEEKGEYSASDSESQSDPYSEEEEEEEEAEEEEEEENNPSKARYLLFSMAADNGSVSTDDWTDSATSQTGPDDFDLEKEQITLDLVGDSNTANKEEATDTYTPSTPPNFRYVKFTAEVEYHERRLNENIRNIVGDAGNNLTDIYLKVT